MNKKELLKKYGKRIELHAHTKPVSRCCSCDNDRFLELYAKIDVDAICITNHFYPDNPIFENKNSKECIDAYLEDYYRIKDMAKPYGIKILLGCEIRFAENCNDYLIYGVNREILEEAFEYLPAGVEKFRKNVKLPDSLFVQAHPFRDGITLINPELLDGIETLNFHPGHNSRNTSSAIYAKENNISICTGGTDFHYDRDYHYGTLLMLSKVIPNDSFELVNLIKSDDYLFLLGQNHIIIP